MVVGQGGSGCDRTRPSWPPSIPGLIGRRVAKPPSAELPMPYPEVKGKDDPIESAPILIAQADTSIRPSAFVFP